MTYKGRYRRLVRLVMYNLLKNPKTDIEKKYNKLIIGKNKIEKQLVIAFNEIKAERLAKQKDLKQNKE